MKTGLALEEIMHVDPSLKKKIESILYTFMEIATIHAVTYVTEGNRNTLTTMDIVFGLKYCARTFFHEPNLEDNIDANLAQLDMEDEDMEDEDTEDEDTEDEDTEDEDTEDTEDTFVRNETSTNPLVLKMNQYVDEWSSWCPTDEAEVMIKRVIDKIESQPDL